MATKKATNKVAKTAGKSAGKSVGKLVGKSAVSKAVKKAKAEKGAKKAAHPEVDKTKKPATKKRGELTTKGRNSISEAQTKRWAAYRELMGTKGKAKGRKRAAAKKSRAKTAEAEA